MSTIDPVKGIRISSISFSVPFRDVEVYTLYFVAILVVPSFDFVARSSRLNFVQRWSISFAVYQLPRAGVVRRALLSMIIERIRKGH